MESSWQLGSFESSDDEDKNKKSGNTPSARRFEPPRILNMSRVHEGQIDLRPRPAEAAPMRAPIFEGLVDNKETSETDKPAKPEEAQPVSLEATPGQVPAAVESLPYGAVPPAEQLPPSSTETAAAEEDDDDDDNEEGQKPAATGQHKTPLAWPGKQPLPSVEQAPALQHPAEFDDVVRQLGSEYAEAPSGSPAETPVSGEIPSPFAASEHEPTLLTHDTGTVDTPPPVAAAGGAPPRPPVGPPGGFAAGGFDRQPRPEPGPESTTAYMYNTAPSAPNLMSGNTAPSPLPSPNLAVEQQAARSQAEYAEKRALRRGLIAGFITGYALKAFLASRKLKRYQEVTQRQLSQQSERLATLQTQANQQRDQAAAQAEQYQSQAREQQARLDRFKANQPSAPRFETPAATPAMVPLPKIEQARPLPTVEAMPQMQAQPEEQTVVDEHGNEIVLQPGQHLERRGWYSVVTDEHGREVPGIINYGKAFQDEQRREQLSASALAGSDSNQPSPAQPAAGGVFTALPGVGVSSVPPPSAPAAPAPMISSGQTDAGHSLPAGQPARADADHQLPKPRNQLVATITSPWLWIAVAVLLIAYFTAALV